MKILYIDSHEPTDPEAGGAERRILKEAKQLAGSGHDITVLAGRTVTEHSQQQLVDGVTVLTVKCLPDSLSRFPGIYLYLAQALFPILSVYRLWRLLNDDEYDVIIDNLAPHPSLAPILGRILNIPVVAIVHEYHDRTALRKYPLPIGAIQLLVQNFLRTGLYNTVIVPREQTKAELQEYGVTEQIHVIPDGINIEKYIAPIDSVDSRSYDLCIVSRLVQRKGLDHLLNAMAEVDHSDISLAIAGMGPQRSRLERLATENDIQDSVEFLGYISEDEKVKLLNNSRVFVFPSLQEGFGVAGLEAMAAGLPIIANDLEILRKLIPSDGGTFVDVRNRDEFSEAITQMVSKTKGELESEGKINREEAKNYSWESIGERSQQIYREIK